MRVKTVSQIGHLVRDHRTKQGWSQQKLAEQVGVSRVWIGHLERGKPNLDCSLILRTLTALQLGVTITPLDPNPLDFAIASLPPLP